MKPSNIAAIIIYVYCCTLSPSTLAVEELSTKPASSSRPDISDWIGSTDAHSFGTAFSLDGVEGYLSGRANEAMRTMISRDGTDWLCSSIADAINNSRRGKNLEWTLRDIFKQDPEVKAAVQAELKKRFKKQIPAELKRIIVADLLGGAVGEEAMNEAVAIADRAMRELDTSLNERLDQALGGYYDSGVAAIRMKMEERGIPEWIDPTDLRSTLKQTFDLARVDELIVHQLSDVMGGAAVEGIRGRVADAMAGNLPPEAISALQGGPDAFEKYVASMSEYLPGRVIDGLKNSILNRPIVKLPTSAYSSILAASAALHFSKAFSGIYVDPFELQRGMEVTRVLIWQVKNKESITLTVMQLGLIARNIAGSLGVGADFDGALAMIKEPIDRIEKRADEIDRLISKPIEEVRGELASLSEKMRRDLFSIQDKFTAPIRRDLEMAQSALDKIEEKIESRIPDGFNGVPQNFDELKDMVGMEDGLFGETGNMTPLDGLDRIMERSGLDKVGRDVKDELNKINDSVSGALSAGVVNLLEAGWLLGPTASIMDIERVPLKNSSDESELDPMHLHTGEYFSRTVDLAIPGRGVNFEFQRNYRARSNFKGELGWQWTHSYAERLLPASDGSESGYTYIDGDGNKSYFRSNGGAYVSPPDMDGTLKSSIDGSLELELVDGRKKIFASDGKIIKSCDKFANCILLEYGSDGLLSSVIDPFGRRVDISRRADGLITAIQDFVGRRIRYEYNDRDELSSVSYPATADGERGSSIAYRYSRVGGLHLISMIMDPSGRVYLENRYDKVGRVIAQRYGGMVWMKVEYGSPDKDMGQRAWITDQRGVMRLYEHDSAGHLIRRWRYDGSSYHLLAELFYDLSGNRVMECNGSRICAEYKYGVDGAVEAIRYLPSDGSRPRVVDIKSKSIGRKIVRDSFGNILSESDQDGTVTKYEYYSSCDPDGDGIALQDNKCADGGGYLKAIIGHAGFQYDTVGNITATIRDDGRKERYVLDRLNRIIFEQRPDESPRRYDYDANDNLRSIRMELDGRVIQHEFKYDGLDRQIGIRREISPGVFADERYRYDESGNMIERIDPDGVVDSYIYDSEGRIITAMRGTQDDRVTRLSVDRGVDGEILAITYGNGANKRFIRNGFGEISKILDTKGGSVEFERDDLGKIIGERRLDHYGSVLAETKYSYDGRGNMIGRSSSLFKNSPSDGRWISERFTQDSIGMVKELRDGGGAVSTSSYDSLGREVKTIGADGVVVRYCYDDLGRMVSETRGPDGGEETTRLEWSAGGRLIAVVDPNGRRSSFEYDGRGNLRVERFPDGSERSIEYDGADGVVKITERDGSEIIVERNGDGQPINRIATRGEDSINQSFAYDPMGRLVSAIEENSYTPEPSEIEILYDSLSRPIAESINGLWVRRRYDDQNRVVALVGPSGEMTSYSYGEGGRLAAVMRGDKAISRYVYDDGRRSLNIKIGDGLIKNITYDSMSREIGRKYFQKNKREGFSWSIVRDSSGLMREVIGGDGHKISYARDAFGRLSSAKIESCMKDNAKSCSDIYDLTYDYSRASDDRFKYDSAGRVISNKWRDFIYDPLGRLQSVLKDGKGLATYSYDPLNRRIAKRMGSGIDNYMWDGWSMISESKSKGSWVDYIYDGLGLGPFAIAGSSDKEVGVLIADPFDSTIGVAHGNEKLERFCSLGPYGESDISDSSCVPSDALFGFAGQIVDRESGLIYMRNRYYDPEAGKFLEPDPMGFKISMVSDPMIPQGRSISFHTGQGNAPRSTFPNRAMNVSTRYGAYPFGRYLSSAISADGIGDNFDLRVYASNDPTRYLDPLGLSEMIYDLVTDSLVVIDGSSKFYSIYNASNRTTKPKGDFFKLGSNGPLPINTTFTIGPPEFYSSSYRDRVYKEFGLGEVRRGESITRSYDWAGSDVGNYNISMGKVRFRVGSSSRSDAADDAAWRRGIFIHGGRYNNYKYPTHGCMRARDDELEMLAADYVNLKRAGDPITKMTVSDSWLFDPTGIGMPIF